MESTNSRDKYLAEKGQYSVDTSEAIRALADAIGGTYNHKAKQLCISVGRLWKLYSKTEYKPPTLDSLSRYIQKAYEQTGIRMTFWVTADGALYYDIAKPIDKEESDEQAKL